MYIKLIKKNYDLTFAFINTYNFIQHYNYKLKQPNTYKFDVNSY